MPTVGTWGTCQPLANHLEKFPIAIGGHLYPRISLLQKRKEKILCLVLKSVRNLIPIRGRGILHLSSISLLISRCKNASPPTPCYVHTFRFIIIVTTCCTLGTAHWWGTKVSYHLVLSPLFWQCPPTLGLDPWHQRGPNMATFQCKLALPGCLRVNPTLWILVIKVRCKFWRSRLQVGWFRRTSLCWETQAKVIVDMIVTTLIEVQSFNSQCALVFLQCLSYGQNRGHCECLFLNCQEDL